MPGVVVGYHPVVGGIVGRAFYGLALAPIAVDTRSVPVARAVESAALGIAVLGLPCNARDARTIVAYPSGTGRAGGFVRGAAASGIVAGVVGARVEIIATYLWTRHTGTDRAGVRPRAIVAVVT